MSTAEHILVVDDDPGTRFLLEEVLTNDGYHVTVLEEGRAALELIVGQEFDLALLDLYLEDQPVGGLDILGGISQKSPDTVVIMLTAHASLETAVLALREGAHDYLFKPSHPAQLRESVRRGLEKRRQILHQRRLIARLETQKEALPPTVTSPEESTAASAGNGRFLELGGLIIDLMRHVVTLDGNLLELSPTEFNFLTHLVSEYPRVISPADLIMAAHGYESSPDDAADVVRYHIYRIRNKIKKTACSRIAIRTVRAVGYTLVLAN